MPKPIAELRPPREPICRDADDPTRPCEFAHICHESRQRLQHYGGLRGPACWAWLKYREPSPTPHEGAA